MYIIKNGCPGCGSCRDACPVKAIKLEKGKAAIDQTKCIQCGICASSCPVKLIKLEKDNKAQAALAHTKKKAEAAPTEAKADKNAVDAVKEVGSDA